MTTASGDAVTLALSSQTHLPDRVVSMSDNANMGDVAIVTTFADYEDVGGAEAAPAPDDDDGQVPAAGRDRCP